MLTSDLVRELVVEHKCGNGEASDAAGHKFRAWHPVLLIKLELLDAQMRELRVRLHDCCAHERHYVLLALVAFVVGW